MSTYPAVKDHQLVGTYPARVHAGGGYVWDAVLEYRVWCHPHEGALDIEQGNDYYYVFETYEEALAFSAATAGAEQPVALVLQEEYIDEPEQGHFRYITKQRLTEWPVDLLSRPRRNAQTLLAFFSPTAASNRVDIVRGLA
jgi:hypothetical protein